MDLPAYCKVLYLYTSHFNYIRLAGLAAFVKFSRSCDLWQLQIAAAARTALVKLEAAGNGSSNLLQLGAGPLSVLSTFWHMPRSWEAATKGSWKKLQLSTRWQAANELLYIYIYISLFIITHFSTLVNKNAGGGSWNINLSTLKLFDKNSFLCYTERLRIFFGAYQKKKRSPSGLLFPIGG